MNTQTNDYNDEPVHYCKYCLSLDNPEIFVDPTTSEETEYCKYCGSTEFEDSHIEEWEKQFEQKYKQGKFLKLNKKWKTIMQSTNNPMVL